MAKGTKIKATFSDGTVLTRTTTMASLVNGYGWVIRGLQAGYASERPKATGSSGFSGSADLARKQISSFKQYIETVTFEEIVPVTREGV